MRKLPHCDYPKAAETHLHGLQMLPAVLPLINLAATAAYRSANYKAVGIDSFTHQQVLELVSVIAKSFVKNEPMNRHMQPSKNSPAVIHEAKYLNEYGETKFGDWEKENIFFWLIRLLVFNQLKGDLDGMVTHNHSKQLSMAIFNDKGNIIGGALNIKLYSPETNPASDGEELFFQAVTSYAKPVIQMLMSQEEASLTTLSNAYADFKEAYESGKVGELFMIARSPLLPTEDTFELVAATMERFKQLGYKYVATAAANQWTGAAFEAMGGVRVYFSPYRATQQLKLSKEGLADETSSSDGYLAAKDSGCMFYILRVA